jgi:hypothetical protein
MSQERPARPRTGEEPSEGAAGPPRAGIAAGEAFGGCAYWLREPGADDELR